MEIFKDLRIEINKEAIVIESKKEFKILSSAPINGGLKFSNKIVNLHIPLEFYKNPFEFLKIKENEIKDVVCLMTGADVSKASIVEACTSNLKILVIVTAGTSNATSITDGGQMEFLGTINIIVIVNRSMTESCMVNAIATITEAKCKALASLDLRSKISKEQATGTSSDAIVIASLNEGTPLEYAGSATELGWLIATSVEKAVRDAIISHDGILPNRPLLKRLEERGIFLEDLISTAMEMYVSHSSFSKEKAKEIFEKILIETMNDINVASLIMAALRINEDGKKGLIPNLSAEDFEKDIVNLVADEILGISISMYIAGYNGLFEFYRFDRNKPGILKKLPPFIDDAIGSLLAGVSSKMYSYMLKGNKNENI
ncbi:MAG: alpha-ribazole phosphatase CobZ [Candidatus Methanomethylicaceae archaeon]|nr:alpha-ribazole phosphatase CobZ [Candidatus Verstraetearchaeota archaeon]